MDLETIRRAITDPAVFAEVLCGSPLWDHQQEILASPADVAGLATGSPLLRGSVLDELKGSVTLSNASVILSTPASQRQVRGWAVDLLILDEAGFIDPSLWRAAEPTIIARPGSRVILTSTPWGAPDHFFPLLFRRGMDRPDLQVQAWHWPLLTA
jgi:hypothetical protein